jgi:hypothetical protein
MQGFSDSTHLTRPAHEKATDKENATLFWEELLPVLLSIPWRDFSF